MQAGADIGTTRSGLPFVLMLFQIFSHGLLHVWVGITRDVQRDLIESDGPPIVRDQLTFKAASGRADGRRALPKEWTMRTRFGSAADALVSGGDRNKGKRGSQTKDASLCGTVLFHGMVDNVVPRTL